MSKILKIVIRTSDLSNMVGCFFLEDVKKQKNFTSLNIDKN